jgi:hypothetical protein
MRLFHLFSYPSAIGARTRARAIRALFHLGFAPRSCADHYRAAVFAECVLDV